MKTCVVRESRRQQRVCRVQGSDGVLVDLYLGDDLAAPRVGQELRLKLQAQRPSSRTMRQWMYVAYGQRVAREEVPTFSCGGLLLRGVHPPQPSGALYLLAAWA